MSSRVVGPGGAAAAFKVVLLRWSVNGFAAALYTACPAVF